MSEPSSPALFPASQCDWTRAPVIGGTAFTVAKPLGRSEPDRFGRSVRVDRWRYAEWGPDGKSGAMLIDEDNDPHETHNLVTDPTHAALVTRLRSLLKAVP